MVVAHKHFIMSDVLNFFFFFQFQPAMPPRIRIDGTVPPDVNCRYQRRKPGIRNDLVTRLVNPTHHYVLFKKQSDPVEN